MRILIVEMSRINHIQNIEKSILIFDLKF
jgi:hypothetical protein